jgi:epoxyqueuosine reductase
LQARVLAQAKAAGFALAGIAPVPRLGSAEAETHANYFAKWLEAGHAGEMEYLKRKDEDGRYLRSAVEVAAPWARSIIVCAAPYGGGAQYPLSTDGSAASSGWIARYAWSGQSRDGADADVETLVPSDYHKVLLARLKAMEAALHTDLQDELGLFESWAYVDTGPIVERAYTAMAGVGWTGKNACTLNENLGSFFFLGVILTSLVVAEDQRAQLPADRCGSCMRCIDACPTDALIAPRQMDASRCISYLTIEHRGAVDPELREGMGRQVFGCDICQDVCPWNARAMRQGSAPVDTALQTRAALINPSLESLAAMTEVEWQNMFFGSPVKRTRFAGFRRNVAIAMGNSGNLAHLPVLREWAASDPDDAVREMAAWATDRLEPK